ncbi:PREDICTED: uncharacterized protein LOC106147006 [Chinchilla lanigera]|uniref:uncharacterized protein LOC106147006 n=1 Tax=Chinchilla lanigera TaxID=34839 RepID=UPI000698E710|nr:PREDICTED: uncharacterized protein LOC106147006 [Chinchilla lanigera]XP_013361912.1 PREDICTED: uncharacterized protein LOC106147006 [Chinchilla lanigera]XP_013361913.1 PREDICTED: uncharacterized protein LOC106147006 [Chinchilla lanigera]
MDDPASTLRGWHQPGTCPWPPALLACGPRPPSKRLLSCWSRPHNPQASSLPLPHGTGTTTTGIVSPCGTVNAAPQAADSSRELPQSRPGQEDSEGCGRKMESLASSPTQMTPIQRLSQRIPGEACLVINLRKETQPSAETRAGPRWGLGDAAGRALPGALGSGFRPGAVWAAGRWCLGSFVGRLDTSHSGGHLGVTSGAGAHSVMTGCLGFARASVTPCPSPKAAPYSTLEARRDSRLRCPGRGQEPSEWTAETGGGGPATAPPDPTLRTEEWGPGFCWLPAWGSGRPCPRWTDVLKRWGCGRRPGREGREGPGPRGLSAEEGGGCSTGCAASRWGAGREVWGAHFPLAEGRLKS